MNPYQQPQNNGYPQQAGPNKYPALPPVQNPQYPPQQPQYPVAGYQPPAQYGNIQAESSKNEERQAISMKIADLDQGFNTGYMNFYKVWLGLLALLCTIALVGCVIKYLTEPYYRAYLDNVVYSFLLLVWNGSQAFFGVKAISEKSLTKANVTCWMTCIGSIPWLILETLIINELIVNPRDGWYGLTVSLFVIISLINLVHIGLNVNGAFRVRKLLIERGLLQEKLDNIDYAFRA